MTLEAIFTQLATAGLSVDPAVARIEPRNGRTAVYLDGARMAWFPHDGEAREIMARERRVLRLLERHCSFAAPRVLHADAAGWEVRAITPGIQAAQLVYDRMAADPAYAQRTGAALGGMLAEQHSRIPREELEGWLPSFTNWPDPKDIPNIPRVIDDPGLFERINRALEAHVRSREDLADPVLIHGDLGPHNFAIDPESGDITGLFDYEAAAFGDRAQDFAYMLLHGGEAEHPDAMLEAALSVYEPLTGVTVDRQRVCLLNAVSAIGFLGYRFGYAPEVSWCGRTLAEDLVWTRTALDAAGF